MRRGVAIGLALLLTLGAAAAGPREPALSADQARMLLALSGANPGTTRLLSGVGLVRIDAVKVEAQGRWLVIRVLTTLVRKMKEGRHMWPEIK